MILELKRGLSRASVAFLKKAVSKSMPNIVVVVILFFGAFQGKSQTTLQKLGFEETFGIRSEVEIGANE